MIDAYERKREHRTTILDKIAKLTGEEPWSGYDEAGVEAIARALTDTDANPPGPHLANTRTARA